MSVSMWVSRHAVPRAWKRSLRAMVSKAVGLDIPPLEFSFAVFVSGPLDQSSSRTLVVNPVIYYLLAYHSLVYIYPKTYIVNSFSTHSIKPRRNSPSLARTLLPRLMVHNERSDAQSIHEPGVLQLLAQICQGHGVCAPTDC